MLVRQKRNLEPDLIIIKVHIGHTEHQRPDHYKLIRDNLSLVSDKLSFIPDKLSLVYELCRTKITLELHPENYLF